MRKVTTIPEPTAVHIQQPKGSKLCGHACLAMLAGVTLDEAVAVVGHRNRTQPSDLVRAAKRLGLVRITTKLPKRAYWGLVKVTRDALVAVRGNPRKHYHWTCYVGGVYHDPAFPRKEMTSKLNDDIVFWIGFSRRQLILSRYQAARQAGKGATMKVVENVARKLFVDGIGITNAKKWSVAKLQERINSLNEAEGTADAELDDPKLQKLLEKVLKANEAETEIEVIASAPAETNGDEPAKSKKSKAKTAKAAAAEEDDEEAEDSETEDEEEDEEEATAKPKKKGKAKTASKRQGMSQIDAAHAVLSKCKDDEGMNAKEMVEAMEKQDLWTSPGGATPHATLSAAILKEITNKGKQSRFKKVSPGHFVAVKPFVKKKAKATA